MIVLLTESTEAVTTSDLSLWCFFCQKGDLNAHSCFGSTSSPLCHLFRELARGHHYICFDDGQIQRFNVFKGVCVHVHVYTICSIALQVFAYSNLTHTVTAVPKRKTLETLKNQL